MLGLTGWSLWGLPKCLIVQKLLVLRLVDFAVGTQYVERIGWSH